MPSKKKKNKQKKQVIWQLTIAKVQCLRSFIVSIKRPSQIIPKLNPSFKALSSIFFVTFCGKYSIKPQPHVEERRNKFRRSKTLRFFYWIPRLVSGQLLWQIAKNLSRKHHFDRDQVTWGNSIIVFSWQKAALLPSSAVLWKTIWDRTSWYVKHFWSLTKYFSKQQPLLGNWELIDSKPCLNCSIPGRLWYYHKMLPVQSDVFAFVLSKMDVTLVKWTVVPRFDLTDIIHQFTWSTNCGSLSTCL